jgi:hypothetical protein
MEDVQDGVINVTVMFVSMLALFVLIADIIPNCMECCRQSEPIGDPANIIDDEYEELV